MATKQISINPYRIGGSMIFRRLMWDLSLDAWRSRHVLRTQLNSYQGQKALILCNGPSLLKVDFELLQQANVYCFGLNKINLLFERTTFRPSCVVAVNRLVLEQNKEFYQGTAIPLYLDSYAAGLIQRRENVAFLHSSSFPMFSRDCSLSIFQGYTVTFVALQLAFHMGFQEVALVGADHTFAVKGPANATVVSTERDESHFDPRYFSGGMQWQLPDLFQSEVAYTMARDAYEEEGRRVVNATVGGKLDVFARERLEDFLMRRSYEGQQ